MQGFSKADSGSDRNKREIGVVGRRCRWVDKASLGLESNEDERLSNLGWDDVIPSVVKADVGTTSTY